MIIKPQIKVLFVVVSIVFVVFQSFAQEHNTLLFKPYSQTMDYLQSFLIEVEGAQISEQQEKERWQQLREYAIKNGDKRLALAVDFYIIHIDRYKYGSNDIIERYCELENKASRIGFVELQITCLHTLASIYSEAQLFENCFAIVRKLEQLIDAVSDEQYSDKIYAYMVIAAIHSQFKDKHTTIIPVLQRAVNLPVKNERYYVQHALALNMLGICYEELERPDSAIIYFSRIREENQFSQFYLYKSWSVIAGKNLADIYVTQGRYNEAIGLYQSAIDYMSGEGDDKRFATSSAVGLLSVYIKRGDKKEAKELFARLRMDGKITRGYYDVAAQYCAFVGEYEQALAYKDSLFMSEKAETEKFNAMALLRVEQRENAVTMQIQEDELRSERQRVMFISITLAVTIVLLSILFRLYRQKQRAYQDLVLKNQQWAITPTTAITLPNVMDSALMAEIEKLMDDGFYLQSDTSLETIATRIKSNPTYISNAINRCYGKGVRVYINEYRIRYAIRLLSDSKQKSISIDELALCCGFNDRQSFYRAFKLITGLSPSDFKSNMK